MASPIVSDVHMTADSSNNALTGVDRLFASLHATARKPILEFFLALPAVALVVVTSFV